MLPAFKVNGNFRKKLFEKIYAIIFPMIPKANRLFACGSLMMFTDILVPQKSNFLKISRTERVKSRLLKKKFIKN